jgi:hypothetical protein
MSDVSPIKQALATFPSFGGGRGVVASAARNTIRMGNIVVVNQKPPPAPSKGAGVLSSVKLRLLRYARW